MTIKELIALLQQVENQEAVVKIQVSYRNGYMESNDVDVNDECIFGNVTDSDSV